MRKSGTLSVAVLTLFAVTIAIAQQPANKPAAKPAAAQPAATPKSVASVKQVMEAMVVPSSDVLFKFGAEAPKDDKDWMALQNNAVTLTESGNLLMIGSRVKDRGDWMKMARALVDAGEVAMKAIQSKNADALSDASNQVYETCETCHTKYLPKN